MHTSIRYGSWIALLAAILAWSSVGYASFASQRLAEARGQALVDAVQESDRVARAQRMQLLAEQTRSERAVLEDALATDVVTIAGIIEAAGASVGVEIFIASASPAGTVELAGDGKLTTLSFALQANGEFERLVAVARHLENLPLVSSVESLSLEHAGGESGSWRMSARIRVLTTSAQSL